MRKKLSLLLIGMLLLSGCTKEEPVTAESLLGNPYGAAVESGDFDVTAKIGGKTINGSLQYDRDGLHYKDNDSEYYIIRSDSYVKRYDLVQETGRWVVNDESSLDTSSLSSLGIITSPVLEDWVLEGDSTYDKAGRFGMQFEGIPGEAPLKVRLSFDKDTKRLLRVEYTLAEEQPGLKEYSLSVAIKGVNNTKVQLPSDIRNNAISGTGGTSSVTNYTLPDELIGTVEITRGDSVYSEYIDVMDELGITGTDYEGKVYLPIEDFNKVALEVQSRRGLTPISPEEASGTSEEAGNEESSTAEQPATAGEPVNVEEPTTPEQPSNAEQPSTPEEGTPLSVAGKSVDTILSEMESRYPGLLQETFIEEEGTSGVLSLAAIAASDESTVQTYCMTWSDNPEDFNKCVAVLVDCGIVGLEDCVSNGADRDELLSMIDSLN